MLKITHVIKTSLLAIVIIATHSIYANAHPVFAKKHGLRCSACHVTPITDGALNSNGWSFKRNGYKFGNSNPGWGGNPGNGNGNGNCVKIGKITICG